MCTLLVDQVSWTFRCFLLSWLTVGLALYASCEQVCAEDSLSWELGPTGTKASLRAVSAPDDSIIWAAGSGGTIIRSSDGGTSWHDCSPAGYEKLEFRSLHAWSDTTACAASAGSPAVILRTTNAGAEWQITYQNAAPEAFFDGLRFWSDDRGMAFSDPVAGAWLVVESDDGGKSWRQIATERLPAVATGEAAFAASNSALCVGSNGAAWIGTGGTSLNHSRILFRESADAEWSTALCPLPSNASSGVFSLLATNEMIIAVGGDYRPDMRSLATAAFSRDGGKSWKLAEKQPNSFRSAVARIPTGIESSQPQRFEFIATGPDGTDVSADGVRWEPLNEVGFHALTTGQSVVFAVGSNGRFARLRQPKR